MEQSWFEMSDVRRRKFETASWIPLRAAQRVREEGQIAREGYISEFFGVGSVAVPVGKKERALQLGWMDVGISHDHRGHVQDDEYVTADAFDGGDDISGINLVLSQHFNAVDKGEWHLHPDLVIALGLKREGDTWISPSEGYQEVARLKHRNDGWPELLEIRSVYLRDYLCARGVGLLMTSYRERIEVLPDASHINWHSNPLVEGANPDRWEGRVDEIHEGGMPYGGQTAVIHMSRIDVDAEEDVPVMPLPNDENVETKSWTKSDSGKKLYRIQGELWRTEWVAPAELSPIVRGDNVPPTVSFITDAAGKQENRDTLRSEARWLWFRPEVVPALAHRRGGSLQWYTANTGRVGCSPDNDVHFGINSLGLVNVYAKDLALLPDWQQKLWSGFNLIPEGKVSSELLASQMTAKPANTQAPEAFLGRGLELLNTVAQRKLGTKLLRHHDQIPDLLLKSHRFRATDRAGLLSLAKDLARLTADSFDTSAIQKIAPPPAQKKLGSIKSLEHLLASKIGDESAGKLLSPLFYIYELRHADAHLPGDETDKILHLVGVDMGSPFVVQGYQLLGAVVGCIFDICKVLENEASVKSQ